MEKDDHFPVKFASFNSPETSNWEHLFGLQDHFSSEPLYLPRKGYIDNIVTLLYKIYSAFEERELSFPQLRLAVRLLMLKYLEEGKEEHEQDRLALEAVIGPLKAWDIEKFNGVLMGAIQGPNFTVFLLKSAYC